MWEIVLFFYEQELSIKFDTYKVKSVWSHISSVWFWLLIAPPPIIIVKLCVLCSEPLRLAVYHQLRKWYSTGVTKHHQLREPTQWTSLPTPPTFPSLAAMLSELGDVTVSLRQVKNVWTIALHSLYIPSVVNTPSQLDYVISGQIVDSQDIVDYDWL